MRTKVKFLLLFFLSFGGFTTLFLLFLQSDYARTERAYFTSYPYREMAARNIPEKNIISPKRMDIAPLMATIEPAAAPPLKEKRSVFISQLQEKPVRKKRYNVKTRPAASTEKPVPTPIKSAKKKAAIKIHPPPDWQFHANLGYAALRKGRDQTAIDYFEQAVKLAPDNGEIHLQLAYIHKKLGQNKQAVTSFKSAIDLGDDRFALRREVERLQNRFEAGGYVIYRDESSDSRQLGADLTRSQAGFELAYYNSRKVQIYGRLLSAMQQDRLILDKDSVQAGLGLRYKPLPAHNLVLSAERLVKMGEFARNDWMMRAGYSLDHGTDYREDKSKWWSYSLYLDAALIDPASPDIFLTGQAIGGYNMTVTDGLVLQPRLTLLASWQKDSFRKAQLFEAGPGVNLRYYFNDTKYEAYRAHIDLTLGYRLKISGNSVGVSGPVIGLNMHF